MRRWWGVEGAKGARPLWGRGSVLAGDAVVATSGGSRPQFHLSQASAILCSDALAASLSMSCVPSVATTGADPAKRG